MGASFSTPVSLLEQLRDPADRGAAARFVDLFLPTVWVYVRRLNVPEAARDDLVQDIFAVLLKTLPTFEYDGAGRFRGWLFTVVKNQWRKTLRRGGGEPLAGRDPPDDRDGPAELVERDEFNRLVLQQAMRILKTDFAEPTWRAFWLLAVDGRSGQDAARELGLSVAAVYKARSKVLRRLRDELQGVFDPTPHTGAVT